MRAVWIGVPEHFLEERHRLGIDECDELWDGVLHMVPPAASRHGSSSALLAAALVAMARRRSLTAICEGGVFRHSKDYRVPDLLLAKPDDVTERGVDSAELVVEILSPYDESRDKFGFYAARKVREIWLFDPPTREVEIHVLVDGAYVRSDTSTLDVELRTDNGVLYITDGDTTHEV